MDMTLLAGLVLLALVLVAVALLLRRHNSRRLERRFGPEYHRAVHEMGTRDKGEAELLQREKRVHKLRIVPLGPQQAARFSEEWRLLQARFVDNPRGVLLEADRLVSDLMRLRGYPMADFDTRAADISVDHPAVVHHYRAARDIALRDRRGEADTEALRQAVVHYRALFSELLEVEEPRHEEAHRPLGGLLHRKQAKKPVDQPHHMESQ
jgi:hypothetical protein